MVLLRSLACGYLPTGSDDRCCRDRYPDVEGVPRTGSRARGQPLSARSLDYKRARLRAGQRGLPLGRRRGRALALGDQPSPRIQGRAVVPEAHVDRGAVRGLARRNVPSASNAAVQAGEALSPCVGTESGVRLARVGGQLCRQARMAPSC